MAERILEAGLEALYQHGFNATSVQDITQAAGVPKGSFYNHFESKEALGVEAVNVYASRMGSMLTPLHSKSVSPLKRLHTYFKKMHQLLSDSQYAQGCMLGNFGSEMSDHSEPIRHSVDSALQAWRGEIESVVLEAQKAGEISADLSATEIASYLLNAWEGAVLRAKIMKSRAPIDTFLKVTFTKVLS